MEAMPDEARRHWRSSTRADYLLRFHQMPLAVLEVGREELPLEEIVSKAEILARTLRLRFAIATDGLKYLVRDLQTARVDLYETPPIPEVLLKQRGLQIDWQKWAKTFFTPWFQDATDPRKGAPRLFQQVAIFETLASFASGNTRALVEMPTGSGKTMVLLQLLWKLLNGGTLGDKQILILTDRTLILDQTLSVLTKFPTFLSARLDRKTGSPDKNRLANILLANFRTLFLSRQGVKFYETLNRADIGLVVSYEQRFSSQHNLLPVLKHFSEAKHLAISQVLLAEGTSKSNVYDHFTATTNAKPVYSFSLTRKRQSLLSPIFDDLHNTAYSLSETISVFAGCLILKLAHIDNADLFQQGEQWEVLQNHSYETLPKVLARNLDITAWENPRLKSYRLLRNIFHPKSLPADLLAMVITGLTEIDLANPVIRRDVASEFDALREAWQSKNSFFPKELTPPKLAAWIAGIVSPKLGESIYDPQCNDGSLLVAMLDRLTSNFGDESAPKLAVRINGAEHNQSFLLLSLARLLLRKGADIELETASLQQVIASHSDAGATFDCIVNNPPFGVRLDLDDSHHFPVRIRTSQAALLLHSLMSLKLGGRAAVIVPDSLLFNSGDRPLREYLLMKSRVQAVIALPERLFGRSTAIKSSLILLSKEPPVESILFVAREYTEQIFEGDGAWYLIHKRLLDSALHYFLGIDKSLSDFNQAWSELLVVNSETTGTAYASGRSHRAKRSISLAMDLALCIPDLKISLQTTDPNENAVPLYEEMVSLLDRRRPSRSVWLGSVRDVLTRDFQLLPQDPGNRLLSNVLELLKNSPEPVKVVKLGEIASVYSGMRPDRYSIFPYRDGDPQPSQGYNDVVTARDLKPVIHDIASSRWADAGFCATLPAEYHLRKDDILLASISRIGTVGIYKDDYTRHPYNDLLVVRLKNEAVVPDYIWRLLQTEPYQRWLKGQAVGAIFQRLSRNVLHDLPIPIPSLEHQRQIAQGFKGSESDDTLISALTRLRPISGMFDFLVDESVAKSLTSLSEPDLKSATCLPILRHLLRRWEKSSAVALEETRQYPYPAIKSLLDWLDARQIQLAQLVGLLELPPSPDRYIGLQNWEHKVAEEFSAPISAPDLLDTMIEEVDKSDPLLAKALSTRLQNALSIIWQMGKLALAECKLMQQVDVNLTVSISPSIIPLKQKTTLTIAIANEGRFGLQNFMAVIAGRESGGTGAEYFAPGKKVSLNFEVIPEVVGQLPISVNWYAQRLDGENCEGNTAFAVDVQELGASQIIPLNHTPYILGTYITSDRQDMFFGRQNVVDEIRRSLRSDGPSSVLILGANRKLGKSSLLIHLQQPEVLPAWMPVYIDMQAGEAKGDREGIPTANLFYLIASQIAETFWKTGDRFTLPGCGVIPTFAGTVPTGLELMEFHNFLEGRLRPLFGAENPYERLRLVVDAVLAAKADSHLLLMFDEFDKLQVGIDSGATNPHFPDNLRNLLHSYPRVSAIIVGSHRLHQISSQYFNALFCLGKRLPFSGLDRESAVRLITQPLAGKLTFAEPAVELIIKEAVCLPYLVQGLCDSIFSICAQTGERVVTLQLVEKAADFFAKHNDYFASLWYEDIKTDVRHLIVCLVERFSGGSDPVSAEFIMNQLEICGIGRIEMNQLGSHLDELVALTVLAKGGDSTMTTYQINIPLLSRWLKQNQIDFERYRLAATAETEDL